ncbi:hypothetical protein F5Y12DRAFT_715530 [Xylaria sp. FL1777]|nr:hypothetical protein F5Y12DRAFT_715530 [Xylaria sp. FL1777]
MPIQFIDNASIDKKTRKLIRSHVAKGKNLGRTIHRPSRHPRKRTVETSAKDTPSEEGPEICDSGNPEGPLSVQRQFQEDLSTSLPFDASRTCRRLFCQFVACMNLAAYPPGLQNTVVHINKPRLFLQYAFVDEAFFHCIVAMSVAVSMSLSVTRQESTEALFHLSRSLRLVNQRLAGGGGLALSDTTLAVVLAMTQHERLLGYHSHALVHFEGLQRIIELRGGISKLVSECPGVAQKAFRADFDFALQLGSPTKFSAKCLPGNVTLDWLREKYRESRAASPPVSTLAICTDEKFRGVFEDICVLAWLVNDNAVHGVIVDDYDFHDVLLLIGYRLLAVRPLNTPAGKTMDKFEVLFHLGLAALMTKFFTLGLKPPDVRLLNRCIVSAILEQQYAAREEQELLLWLLFTGKATVFTGVDEDIWLIPKISQVTSQLGLSTWDHVSGILRKFPWVMTFSNDTSHTLWDQSYHSVSPELLHLATMQFTLAALATLAVAVSAQTWNDIPACAQPCILTSVAAVTTCSSTDYQCICDNRDIVQNDAESCVIAECGLDVALNQVLPAVNAACDAL